MKSHVRMFVRVFMVLGDFGGGSSLVTSPPCSPESMRDTTMMLDIPGLYDGWTGK